MTSTILFKGSFLLGLSAVLLTLSGCNTAHPKAYSAADAPTRLHTAETNGLRFTVDPILDKQRSHKYFSTDTIGKGIVPVFVRIENLNSPGSVLAEKEQFQIALNSDTDPSSPLAGEVKHRSTTGDVLAGTGLLTLSSPLI